MPPVSGRKKNILEPLEVFSSPLLMWFFSILVETEEKRTLQPHYGHIYNQYLCLTWATRLKARCQSFSLFFTTVVLGYFKKSVGERKTHAWLKENERRNVVNESGLVPHLGSGQRCRQVAMTASSSSLPVTVQECAFRHSCLLKQFVIPNTPCI